MGIIIVLLWVCKNITSRVWATSLPDAYRVEADRPHRRETLAEAVTLYRGDFLEGFYVKDSVPFEDWGLLIRDRLQRQAGAVLQRLAETHEGQGDYGHACAYAWRWVEPEPWREKAGKHEKLCGSSHMRLLVLGTGIYVSLSFT